MPQIEWDYYITPDGEEHDLHDFEVRAILSHDGYGMPPLEWHTTRGPYQHGETALDYRLRPRVIVLVMAWRGFSRERFWINRNTLLDIIRPNRSLDASPGILRKILPTGDVRDIEVQPLSGPSFGPSRPDQWREWSFENAVRFVAHDPTFFDPTLQTYNAINPVEQELVYDISPFIIFGPMSNLHLTGNLVNPGTWRAWPTILFTGPMVNPVLINTTIDESLTLEYEVLGGRVVTMDLTPGRKTVTDDLGNNLLAYVSEDSDLATWRLEVDPIAPAGVNQIELTVGGIQVAQSEVSLQWHNRYIGI